MTPLRPYVSLRPSATSTALFTLYGPLPPLQHSVFSSGLCFLKSPFHLWPSVPPYDPLFPLRPSIPLRSYVPSTLSALSTLSVPWWKIRNTNETTPLVSQNVLRNALCFVYENS
jgi:hypothetical protein